MTEEKKSLSQTQPLPNPTVADVLEVFAHFQEDILRRIDERDENMLKVLQKITSDFLEQYQHIMQKSDNHGQRLSAVEVEVQTLKKRYYALIDQFQAFKLNASKS